VLRLEKE